MKIINRIKCVKNIEIYIAIFLVLVLLLVYFSSGTKNVSNQKDMTNEEARLASTLSNIKGVGEVSCMITYSTATSVGLFDTGDDGENEVEGVVIVAKGANDTRTRIEIKKAVCFALDIDASKIEVFEMK